MDIKNNPDYMANKDSLYEKPIFCDLIINENCMLKCKMCKMWQSNNDGTELGIDVWKIFIDSFYNFVGDKAQIQFVGGEPLLKKGILDLIGHAAKKGFFTKMTTNAYLIDETVARRIVDSGLSTIILSLDSLERQMHDFLRGIEGVYDNVMKSIEMLSKVNSASLEINIVTTIMQPNLDDLLELTEWANQNSTIHYISFQAIMQPFFTDLDDNWYMKEEFSFLWPKDTVKVNYILDRLIDFKKQGYKITNPISQFNIFKSYFKNPGKFIKTTECNLGYNSISVNTSGKIFLCLSLEPIGDIQNDIDMEELWFSERASSVRQQIKGCQKNCKSLVNCFFAEE